MIGSIEVIVGDVVCVRWMRFVGVPVMLYGCVFVVQS